MRVADQKITDFLTTLNLGLEWIGDAGRKLVDILDSHPSAFEDIVEAGPSWLTSDVLKTIEAIGRGTIAPEMLLLPHHVFTRLLPLATDDQVRAIAGVEIAKVPRNGHHSSVYTKPAARLTEGEARRAIGPNGIRSPKEQLATLNRKEGKSLGWIMVETDDLGLKCKQVTVPRCSEIHRIVVTKLPFAVEFIQPS